MHKGLDYGFWESVVIKQVLAVTREGEEEAGRKWGSVCALDSIEYEMMKNAGGHCRPALDEVGQWTPRIDSTQLRRPPRSPR